MISYNALIIWVPLIVFLLFVFNRWNEKRLIRQVEKILSPVKKDVLFEAPKLHLQHLKKAPIDAKSNGHQANVGQEKVDQVRSASTVNKTFVKDRDVLRHVEGHTAEFFQKPQLNLNQQHTLTTKFDNRTQEERKLENTHLENIKPVQSTENKITKHIPENLVSTHREIDVAFDEMLENMAKRASMRKK
jgi:hypothetical protein